MAADSETWHLLETPEGELYYYNRAKQKTQWEQPTGRIIDLRAAAAEILSMEQENGNSKGTSSATATNVSSNKDTGYTPTPRKNKMNDTESSQAAASDDSTIVSQTAAEVRFAQESSIADMIKITASTRIKPVDGLATVGGLRTPKDKVRTARLAVTAFTPPPPMALETASSRDSLLSNPSDIQALATKLAANPPMAQRTADGKSRKWEKKAVATYGDDKANRLFLRESGDWRNAVEPASRL